MRIDHPMLLLSSPTVGASLFAAWGVAGKYTLLSEVVGPAHRLAVNAIVSALGSAAVIAGPALAGVLIDTIGPGWLIAADAATFAYLAAHAPTGGPAGARTPACRPR